MRRLTVLYDGTCRFCVHCRLWLERQPQIVRLQFLSARSLEARDRFPRLWRETPEELLVIDDEGGVYRGADAWILCLYALEDYRAWSLRLASPTLKPFARAAFAGVSAQRHAFSGWLGTVSDPEVEAMLKQTAVRCDSKTGDACRKAEVPR